MSPTPIPPEIRFFRHVAPAEPDECWLWTGYCSSAGYGRFGVCAGQVVEAYRFSYELAYGPVPPGLEVDHLCRERHCVNPAHLEAVTRAENNRRKDAALGIGRSATHCKHGHEFEPDNTYIKRNGTRECRACSCRRNRERRAVMA